VVTGGNGFIGSHLVEALAGRGYELQCLVRKTSNLQWLQDVPVEFLRIYYRADRYSLYNELQG